MTDEHDRRFLAAAVALGRTGNGETWPNPSVGAILARDGRVVGRGRTARGGQPHAEVVALAEAGHAARGATLYVSLEPCSHYGRSPPCADALIAAGVARVVSALVDPNPLVGGQGIERLRAAGIDVDTDVLPGEAARAHAGHLASKKLGRPYLTLKLAVSAEGGIGRRGEARVQVTGELARRHVQALRSRYDAILVGRGTAETDDPELTCRLPGLEHRSPVRIVLDSDGRLEGPAKLLRGPAPTWILTAAGPDRQAGHVRWIAAPRAPRGIDLAAALSRLAGEGITRILVEGGARVARGLLEADLVDEVMLFRSPAALGGNLVPALAGLPLAAIEQSSRFHRLERRSFGPDRMSRYERQR